MSTKGSVATENFIKTVYKLEQGIVSDAKLGYLARELEISNAAATDMARKLAQKNLIIYEKYKAIKLTPEGNKMALGIIRRHRLWETFLHQVFGLTMHEIHREAEVLEHMTSDFLADKINVFLGYPTTDPHGDPIPDAKGVLLADQDTELLSLAKSDRKYKICRLSGSDKEFFDFCQSNHLKIGSSLSIKRQYDKNKMTEIEVNNTKILLNEELANTIYVKEYNNN